MIARAMLLDGSTIEFVPDPIGEGGEKIVYFTPDRRFVVALFKDPKDATDPQRLDRLQAILGKFNPTTSPKDGALWSQFFCWPTAIVVAPGLGVVAPTYPASFYFPAGACLAAGKEKKGKWFSSARVRKHLAPAERGNWLSYLRIGIVLARSVGRLHSAGLAHSDLSSNNVLIDPVRGASLMIDIDSLVVPGVYPPKVIGTPGYIAPEVVAGRAMPSIRTDLHALAVLLYEYLLLRHPLSGPKVHTTVSTEEDERLSLGEKALFIENKADTSNRPAGLKIPCDLLGPYIAGLFQRAFVDGLQTPDDRPTAIDWERALVRSTDLLLPCHSASCEAKWFVFCGDRKPRCPFCGTPYAATDVTGGTTAPVLSLYSTRKPGQYMSEKHRLVLWHNWPLCRWHVFDNIWPGADADKTPIGYCSYFKGKWLLVNHGESSMSVVEGQHVPPGHAVELTDGMKLRLSNAPHGRLAVVQILGT